MKLKSYLHILNVEGIEAQLFSCTKHLLAPLDEFEINRLLDQEKASFTDVCSHSGHVLPGALFFAIPGFKLNGLNFIEQALASGATGIVIPKTLLSELASLEINVDVIIIVVSSIREALSIGASEFYSHPTKEMTVAGVTGTNGKTSVAWIICQLAALCGRKSGYMGTVGVYIYDDINGMLKLKEQEQTVTDPITLHRQLREFRDYGIEFVALEVTSIGLTQARTFGVEWDAVVCTNLTQDHLDYHGSMEQYATDKKLLFNKELIRSSKKEKYAICNLDDGFGVQLFNECLGQSEINSEIRTHVFYEVIPNKLDEIDLPTGEVSATSIGFRLLSSTATSSELQIMVGTADEGNDLEEYPKQYETKSLLIGRFMAENIAAALSVCFALGIKLSQLVHYLPRVTAVPGRLQVVTPPSLKEAPRVVVDYSHTPDSLEKAQNVLRDLLPLKDGGVNAKLITVFGCGGDRDRTKRSIMGESVARLSDIGIATSDNPRTEDPLSILKEIEQGLSRGSGNHCKYELIQDRYKAIERAIYLGQAGDVVLIAGKGHEDYQETMGKRIHFDDAEVAESILREKYG